MNPNTKLLLKMEAYPVLLVCCSYLFYGGMGYPVSDYAANDYGSVSESNLGDPLGPINDNNLAEDYLSKLEDETDGAATQLADFISWALENGYSREDTERFLEQYYIAQQQQISDNDAEYEADENSDDQYDTSPYYDIESEIDPDGGEKDANMENSGTDDELLSNINQYYGYGLSQSPEEQNILDLPGEDNQWNPLSSAQVDQAEAPFNLENNPYMVSSLEDGAFEVQPSKRSEEKNMNEESYDIKLYPGIVGEHTSDTKKQLMARAVKHAVAEEHTSQQPASTTSKPSTAAPKDLLQGKRGMVEKPEYIQTHEDPSKTG